MTTRREILASFLGLPLALAGCSSRPQVTDFDGEIVGPSMDVGHRLRDGLRLKVPEDRWQKKKVVIVGGGVAGLSAAWRLKRMGFDDFVLLELESVIGGTSRSGRSPVVAYPWGAHYLPLPMRENDRLIQLLQEMSILEGVDEEGHPVAREQYLCRDPQERIFYVGRWHEGLYLHAGASQEDRRQMSSFEKEVNQWVDWRDGKGRRAFAIPRASGSDDAEVTALDRVSMQEWLDARNLTSSRLRWYVDYACRDDYGMSMSETSAWAGLFYFASRRRKSGQASQPILTWPEGNGRLVSHMASSAKKQLHLGLAVTEINPRGPREIEVTALDVKSQRPIGYRAEKVIYAGPQFVGSRLIRNRRVEGFEHSPWLVANVHLKSRPKSEGFPMAWDNVLYESRSLGYVVATHQALIDHGPTVLTWYYPMCDDRPVSSRKRMQSLDWRECADIALTDLEQAHPEVRRLTTRVDVMRWGHAMIRPRVGFVWSQDRRDARRPMGDIHFANTDLSSLPLFEEAFYHGNRAADEILSPQRRAD